jgi:peptidoglycan/LPS O-acetylase OafA/YrhL
VLFRKNVYVRRTLLLVAFLSFSQLYASNVDWFASHHLSKSFIAYAANFFTGMMVAELYLSYKTFFEKSNKNLLWDAVGIGSLIAIIHFSGYQSFYIRMLVFISYILLFTSLFKGPLLRKVLTAKWITIIGGMCYSIYLIHYPIIYAVEELAAKHLLIGNYYADIIINVILLLPVVFTASAVFFLLFEKPFMLKGRKYRVV